MGELFRSSEKRNERYQIFIYLRPKLIDVKAGASGDMETDEEISTMWDRYSKLSGIQAANALAPRTDKKISGPVAAETRKKKNEDEAKARKEKAEADDDEAARLARIKELESKTGIRLRRRNRSATELDKKFGSLSEHYRQDRQDR
jgi:hypothetical protein